MTELTEFTPEQTEALKALEAAFGPVDPMLHNVTSGDYVHDEFGYRHWINRSLTEALRSWGQYQYALTVDWEEKARLDREAREASRAERAEGVRDTVMTGFLAGLISKGSKAGEVMFDTTDKVVLLTVLKGRENVVFMAYDKEKRTLETQVSGEIFIEDVTNVHGNARPRDQIKGYAAVVDFLDGHGIDTLT